MGILASVRTRASGQPEPWKPLPEAKKILEDELEFIETFEARAWYRYEGWELAERPEQLHDGFDALPKLPYLQLDDAKGRHWRVFDGFDKGTLTALKARPAPVSRRTKAVRPVDAVRSSLAQRTAETLVNPGVGPMVQTGLLTPSDAMQMDGLALPVTATRPIVAGGRPAVRGAAAIVRRLARRGATVRLAADGSHLVVDAPAGRLVADAHDLVAQATPLLLVYLRGETPYCGVNPHPDGAREAVSVALGGALICSECLAGGAS